MKGTSKN